MGKWTVRFCWPYDGRKSYPRAVLRWGYPHGQDQGQDQKAGLDSGRGYPDCNSLVFPGWEVWYYLPLSSPAGWLVKKEPVPVIQSSFLTCSAGNAHYQIIPLVFRPDIPWHDLKSRLFSLKIKKRNDSCFFMNISLSCHKRNYLLYLCSTLKRISG